MITTRILPPDEWPRLAGTEAETVWPLFNPSQTIVLAVEEDGALVGSWSLVSVVHAECVWIAPEHRKRSVVARKLWRFMHDIAGALGARTVVTAAGSDDVRQLLERHGATKLPDSYVMRVAPCQQQ